MQAGEKVDEEGENSGHDEGVGCYGDDVSDLDVHLREVSVQPPAWKNACVDAVETNYVVGAEERVEEESYHTPDRVLCEDIESIVDADPEFHCEVG